MPEPLTPAQKKAGRIFRDQARARMAELVPRDAHEVPGLLRHVRHECPLHAGRTWAVEMREHYLLNPAMDELEEGRLAWVWKSGTCKCGFAIRSGDGRMVDRFARGLLRGAIREGGEAG